MDDELRKEFGDLMRYGYDRNLIWEWFQQKLTEARVSESEYWRDRLFKPTEPRTEEISILDFQIHIEKLKGE